MKFLIDENLSDRLVEQLAELYAGSRHVKQLGLVQSNDESVWEHARRNDFVLLTKDKDFHQLSAVRGAPPKVVWVRVGNRSTAELVDLLRRRASAIESFAKDAKKVLLILVE